MRRTPLSTADTGGGRLLAWRFSTQVPEKSGLPWAALSVTLAARVAAAMTSVETARTLFMAKIYL
jgi:hypothetical protein